MGKQRSIVSYLFDALSESVICPHCKKDIDPDMLIAWCSADDTIDATARCAGCNNYVPLTYEQETSK